MIRGYGDVGVNIAGTGNSSTTLSIDWALVMSHAGAVPILTHHKVEGPASKPKLGPGAPVDRDYARQLLESLNGKAGRDGWVAENMLYRSDRVMAWFSPAKMGNMFFRMGRGRKALRVPWPTLVFIAERGGDLLIFAAKGASRPGADTQLFNAPIANVGADGRMCWGSVEKPEFGVAQILAFENAVFRTYFTGSNHDRTFKPRGPQDEATPDDDAAIDEAGPLNQGRSDLFRLYSNLQAEGATEFPAACLVPTKLTLGAICER